MRHQRLRPVRTSFQPEAEEDACRDLPRACVRSAAGHRVMSRQHSQTSKCGALAWVRCHSVQGQGLSAQASEASELAPGLGGGTARSALPLAGSGPPALWEGGRGHRSAGRPCQKAPLGSARSQHHGFLPHPMGYRGSCQPERPPFRRVAGGEGEVPAFQLSQGLGPWTRSVDNGAWATVRNAFFPAGG